MSADSFKDLLGELLAPMGGVTIKRMFGGLGIFRDGAMFGMVAADTLYFKADEETRGAYEAEGCRSFTYAARSGRQMDMPYWRVPERLLDDGEELRRWAFDAVKVAGRAKAEKPPARKVRNAAVVSAEGGSRGTGARRGAKKPA